MGYQQVIEWVKSGIAGGELSEGMRLPSEKELGERFGLSRQTIRHATGELEKERIVERKRGSGTYIAKEKGHKPHKGKKTMNIAVMLTYMDNYIFPPTLKGVNEGLAYRGYRTQLYLTDDNVGREAEILRGLIESSHIDGLIAEPCKSALPNPNIGYYRKLMQMGLPVLFINASYRELETPCIRMDDQAIGKKAVELLYNAGHRKIGGIFQLDDMQGHLRYAGYLDGIRSVGLDMDDEHVAWIDAVTYRNLSTVIDPLMQRIKGLTGIFCYNDTVACRVIEEYIRRGKRVPEDISVVGVDDAEIASTAIVPITTFPHPKDILGRRAAAAIVEMIETKGYDGNHLYRSEPVIRKSLGTVFRN